jgi:hypothetical protein
MRRNYIDRIAVLVTRKRLKRSAFGARPLTFVQISQRIRRKASNMTAGAPRSRFAWRQGGDKALHGSK